MRPYSPIPRFVHGDNHQQLIRRLFLQNAPATTQRVDLVTTTNLRVAVIDSGTRSVVQGAEGDTCVHVLWQSDEARAFLEIDGDVMPIAPGDTAAIPGGDRWKLSENQLAVLVVKRTRNLGLPLPPTHGNYHYSGHNRETRIDPCDGTSLHRWKLTEPLTLPAVDRDRILVGLYANVALTYNDGVEMLQKGEASVIRPETGQITLVPNGLAYVLVID